MSPNLEPAQIKKRPFTDKGRSILRVGIFHRSRRRKRDMEIYNNGGGGSTDHLEVDHHVPRLTLSPPSPGLNRWGSLTSQESYRGASSSRFEHELRKCLGSDYDDQVLLKSYSCAWQKDILVHGRLYITQHWFCFYSNILGFETKTCISCLDVTAVRKHKTAKLIPNAIQIETEDKKYGFSSFYHRDKTYLVLITIWQNALTRPPLSVDALRQDLKTLKVTKEQEKLIMGRRSKSTLITSEGSFDYDSSAVSVADYPSSTSHINLSSSDTITNPMEDSDEDRQLRPHLRHAPCSTSSSPSATPSEDGDESAKESDSDHDNESESSRTIDDSSREKTEEEERDGEEEEGVDYRQEGMAKRRSPSLVTLRSESPREGVGVAKGGGSPNIFHHWKQMWNFSSAWRRITLVRPVQLVRKPIRSISMCSTSQFINLFISIAIIFMFVYMLTMFCHLSQVNPSLRPYLKYQPWCALCTDSLYQTAATQGREHLSMLSRILLPATGGNHAAGRSPPPSVLPNT